MPEGVTLSQTEMGRVALCGCGQASVHFGAVSMRMTLRQMGELAELMQRAAASMQALGDGDLGVSEHPTHHSHGVH